MAYTYILLSRQHSQTSAKHFPAQNMSCCNYIFLRNLLTGVSQKNRAGPTCIVYTPVCRNSQKAYLPSPKQTEITILDCKFDIWLISVYTLLKIHKIEVRTPSI